MQTHKKGNTTHHVFNGMEEVLEIAERPSLSRFDTGRKTSTRQTTWSGAKDLSEAIGFARYGEPETLAKVEAATRTLRAELPDLVERYDWQAKFAEAGDDVDVGLHLSGEPECLVNFEQARQPGQRIAHLCIHGAASSSFSPEELARQGQSALAVIDALEAAGIRVEVTWGIGLEEGGYQRFFEVPLKRAEEALDMSRLAFAAHPSAFRRLAFALLDALVDGEERKTFGAGYGYPIELPGEYDVESVALDGRKDDILSKAREALETLTK